VCCRAEEGWMPSAAYLWSVCCSSEGTWGREGLFWDVSGPCGDASAAAASAACSWAGVRCLKESSLVMACPANTGKNLPPLLGGSCDTFPAHSPASRSAWAHSKPDPMSSRHHFLLLLHRRRQIARDVQVLMFRGTTHGSTTEQLSNVQVLQGS
jgi:hypothetical protein